MPPLAGIVTRARVFRLCRAALVEFEIAAAPRIANGPAGEAAGHFGYVLLGVSAIDAEGVQFHQLAAVVFIQALAILASVRSVDCQLSRKKSMAGLSAVARRRSLKMTEHVRANHVTFVGGDHIAVSPLIEKDVEVVVPEIGEDFFELAIAVNRAKHFGLDQVLIDYLYGAVEDLDLAAQVGRADG